MSLEVRLANSQSQHGGWLRCHRTWMCDWHRWRTPKIFPPKFLGHLSLVQRSDMHKHNHYALNKAEPVLPLSLKNKFPHFTKTLNNF